MVRHAVEQMDDPVRIQIQGRHFPPEAPGALLVGPNELGLRQLTGEKEDQLALLPLGKAEGWPPRAPGPRAREAGGGRLRRPAL
jgi:hypothetical protein